MVEDRLKFEFNKGRMEVQLYIWEAHNFKQNLHFTKNHVIQDICFKNKSK